MAALLALLLLGLALAACGGDDDAGGEELTGAERWAGTFQSSFGELTFEAEGERVTGRYAYCGGRLQGTVKGDRLAGRWQEDPAACEPGQQRDPTAERTGTFQFRLSSDNSSFSGSWRYASGIRDPQGSTWEGTRTSD